MSPSRHNPGNRQLDRGFSLIELLIVVALLAMIAAIAVPAFDSNDDAALDSTAAQVASALRFAQAEAIRSGHAHGVIGDTAAQTIRVYRLDDSVNPPVVVYDVYDPFTKQPYAMALGRTGIELISAAFQFDGYALPLPFVGFSGSTGVPKYNDSGTIRLLGDGKFRLGRGGSSRDIEVSPMTGRVRVQ